MRGESVFRRLLLRRSFNFRSLSSSFPRKPNYTISTPTKTDSSIPRKPYTISIQESRNLPHRLSNFARTFCSPPSSVPPNIALVKSAGEFNDALGKAQNESKSAIFYFTATWCGPCRIIAPKMDELASKYPHVTIYKVDIDTEGLESSLAELKVFAVPTFNFFQEGEHKSQVVGADFTSLVNKMKTLYEK